MSLSFLYDITALLVLVFVLAGSLDRNKRRSGYLLLAAVGLFVADLVLWLVYTR